MKILEEFKRNIKNIPGKKTNRKIVALFFDDYGTVRVKNKDSYENLKSHGIPMDRTPFTQYDTLVSSSDLLALFDVLKSVKDKNGKNACVTAFTNVANPDFDKIRKSNFTTYFREPFTETIKKYGKEYDGVLRVWKQGIAENIFFPAYHGTEHININRFMKALKSNHHSTMLAFDNESICVPALSNEMEIPNYTTTFDVDILSENEKLKEDIVVGLDMFEEIFGFRSRLFTPGAGIYSPLLDKTLAENDIKYINTERFRYNPLGNGKYNREFIYNGKKSEVGQNYIIRNGAFEPTGKDGEKEVNQCLANIEAAFRWGAPAIISSHRMNFVGHFDKKHRDDNLTYLAMLLKLIVQKWPNVEFLNGEEMADAIF